MKKGGAIAADVEMIQAGISTLNLNLSGSVVDCYTSGHDVMAEAMSPGVTRVIRSIRKAV